MLSHSHSGQVGAKIDFNQFKHVTKQINKWPVKKQQYISGVEGSPSCAAAIYYLTTCWEKKKKKTEK